MSTATLSTKSPLQFLLQYLEGAQDLYDIAAACYHTIMQFQRGHESEFIITMDYLSNKPENKCSKTLEQFRVKLTNLFVSMNNDTESIGFQKFLNETLNYLRNLECPLGVEINKYISFFAFCTLELVDMEIESNPPSKDFIFPDHGPLNKNVCTDECSVYFHENNSFLSNIYRLGNDGFRKPLHNFRLGSIFRKILMFECTEFNASIPRVIPVLMTDACKQQLLEKHQLRIASIPFIGFDTFDFYEVGNDEPCRDTPNGAFYVKYREDLEKINTQHIIRLLDLAVEQESNIIVFPEFIMSSNMLAAICEHLSKLQQIKSQHHEQLILVLAGTNFEYNDQGQGNNILHILTSNGTDIGQYYKFSPFLTQHSEIVHGATYGSSINEKRQINASVNDKDHNNKITESCICSERKYLQNWEVLSNPGKECTLIDIEGIGRILPAICRDAIDGNYTDTLAKLFMPSILLIPAWSTSVTSFDSRLSGLAETIHTTSLLCNCCNAVDKNKRIIGKFVYPTKQGSKMVAKKIPLKRAANCLDSCSNKGGCVHIIDLNSVNSALNVDVTHLSVDGKILV